ncbi:PLP-dependent aminotransferase family protein [Amycolatopsis sp. PS_44_ISF1]|uniref:PLP-dependent aminotransferase family protein n=1 Tax=Amycolatopsis sp. PS_44_ISF1 TaxID=2974917 RepID=UPI0028DF312B|nr:PLP-dependent aminotransferase family protein [Amycolatopsis sp. PS_44_ISF1]MDT8913400.1 PLP-dependent aminotransferase family protein [Amycolatopsis sp. PS_44_ISF1]
MATGEITAMAPVGLGWLTARIGERTGRGIAGAVSGLIRDGEVLPGARLPTVRALAAELSVSPTTIAEAWAQLRAAGLIGTGRRRGTTVLAPPPGPAAARSFEGWRTIDLEHGRPDPALLPPLEEAVAAGVRMERSNSSAKDFITPRLRAAVDPAWPFPAEDWTVAAGGHEGVTLACQALARPGDVIAVEEPTAPWLLEVLRRSRIHVVPVRCDEHGPQPESLTDALTHRPAAFVYQPRAHVPLGHSVPAERIAALAAVLDSARSAPVVIEHDDLGPLASGPALSLGTHRPDRVLLVRSYCTAFGPELRSCVLAGAAPVVARVRELRASGPIWSSRILQDAQAFLLTDAATGVLLRRARGRYAERRAALADALAGHGIRARTDDGLALWVPVPDETRTLVTLAANGVSAGPGRRCHARPTSASHIRVAIGQLPDDPGLVTDLATMIATAAGRRPQRSA